MKRTIAGIALVGAAVLVASTPVAAETLDETTVSYEASDENIANPQRGFYHHTETH